MGKWMVEERRFIRLTNLEEESEFWVDRDRIIALAGLPDRTKLLLAAGENLMIVVKETVDEVFRRMQEEPDAR